MNRFLVQLSILSILIAACIWGWNNYGPVEKHLNALWLILGVFILITTLVHYILVRSVDKNPGSFVRTFMASTSIKLFVYLIIITLYSMFNKSEAVLFIFGFLLMYLLFTGFEVITIMFFLKRKKPRA